MANVATKAVSKVETLDRNDRKVREGVVVSDKMDKTVVVLIRSKQMHPLYKKTINKSKRLKAHDENNECGIGDTVEIVETRKLSKDKCWRVSKIIEKAK
ncbi:MAG: 30S ribosomal protein S17 [Firmicutes bacterium]|nr:30S ribosomal protein S17 [Bacillota bacterium]